MRVRKEAFERQFLTLLHRLTPSSEFLALFRDVVLEVWNRKKDDAQAQLSAIKRKLTTLTDRKNALMDKYLDGFNSLASLESDNSRFGVPDGI